MKRIVLCFLMTSVAHSLCAQSAFDGLTEAIEQGDYGNLKAMVISQQGEIVYEQYFRGTQSYDLHLLNSVTKSVGSALVGIAKRQGNIQLDQTLDDFFASQYPMNSAAFLDKKAISVEAVLQQRHGIAWDEWTLDYRNPLNPTSSMIASGDWYQYVLTRPVDAQPGEKFAYSTGVSNLMGRMLRVASGQSPRNFANSQLFGPLGIFVTHWEGYSQLGLGYGLTDWPNPDGDEPLGFGLWLKPTDMLKIGELYRNGGVYNGTRILDKEWIEASWTTWSNSENTELFTDRPGSGYGYQWWVTRLVDSRGRTWPTYYADGWGRQYILVIPGLELVVVSVSDDYDYDGPGTATLLRERVLPELEPVTPMFQMNAGLNDAWVNPNAPLQGLFVTVFPVLKRVFLGWFSFDSEPPTEPAMAVFGAADQRWVTAAGMINGNQAELKVELSTGGLFNAMEPAATQDTEYGTINLEFANCQQGTVEFDFPSTGQSGSFNIQRIVDSNAALCESLDASVR